MALFDLNSRYTKSMENGGSYEREASIGGYNRKELRGLNRQARRGTLTQRERARLKYLTDERKGRRKRGLLSGLGGAAATLGGLALAGKLGKGEGGGGAALMDAIKSRLAAGKVRANELGEKGEGSMEEMMVPKPENVREERGLVGGEREEPMSDEGQVGDLTRGADFPYYLTDDQAERQDRLSRRPERAPDSRDFSGELSEDVGEGTLSSLRNNYNMMKADDAEKAAEEQRLRMLFDIDPFEGVNNKITSRQPSKIKQKERALPPNSIEHKLEALKQLRKFFGNRYN